MTILNTLNRLFFIGCLWAIAGALFASTLSAHIEPTHVSPGEPFTLTLELDENAPSGLPDFGPLSHDFYIHGTAHSASYVFQNGQSKASTRWDVTLVAKHSGQVTIPAIQVGKARSNPITLHVGRGASHKAPQSPTSPKSVDQALFVKTKLSNPHPFVNQQLLYSVKIYHYSSILDAAYQPPNLSDALVIPIGGNQQHQVIENGRPYLVEEQKYAFFPQKAGTVILFPPKFQALIYDDIPRRAEAQGDSASLDIQEIPAGFNASTWLPAKMLSLKESYDQKEKTFTEGSTLTRTMTLKVTGLPAELMPPLEPEQGGQFKLYPERPSFNNTIEGDNVVGSATIKVSYLLNQTGTITIPKQTIMWFNTDTGQKAEATLPARTLQVTPEAGQAAPPSEKKHTSAPQTTEQPLPTPEKRSVIEGFKPHLALLLTFALISLIFILTRKQGTPSRQPSGAHAKALKNACLKNNPQKAREALLAWAQHTWPDARILNLDDVIQLASDDALTKALKELSEALYHPDQTIPWQGERLWQAIQKQKKQKTQKKSQKRPPLPPINPQ